MNKKILLSILAIITAQTAVYSAVAHASKVVTPAITGLAGKFPAIIPTTTTAMSSSRPMVHLTAEQIESFTNNLSRVGARSYLPQIQMIWESDPELLYNAQQAVQAADREAQRRSFDLIIQEAKRLAAQQSGLFSIQDAIINNLQLEKLINQDLANNIDGVTRSLSDIAYDSYLYGKIPNKNSFYEEIESPLDDAHKAIKNILTDSKITPQQASSKLNAQITEIQKAKSAAQKINKDIKDSKLQSKVSSIISDLEATESSLRQISGILQKTAPAQSKTATFPELKNWTESISSPSAEQTSLQPSTVHEVLEAVPMPKAIEPFFKAQVSKINTHIEPLATAMKELLTVNIPNLGLLPHEKQVFDLEKIKITNHIKVFNNILNQIKTLSLDQNGLDTMKNLKVMLEVVVSNLLISLETIKREISTLPASKQSLLLKNLQTMIKEILAIVDDVTTTQLILIEFNAQKDALEAIKQNVDLAQFTINSTKDLTTIQKAGQSLQQIFSSGNIITKDKAPMPMLEVFDKNLISYLKTIEKIKTITKLEDLRSLQIELESQQKELIKTLNALEEKISWLPTSAAKNKALEEFAKLKLEFMLNKQSIDQFFKKANEIEEKHMFVIIKKNEIEMGYLVLVDKYNAVRLSITKNFPESQMSLFQREALSKFDNSITEMISDLNKIKNVHTSFELNQLTKEFFKANKLAESAKKDSSLIAYGSSSLMVLPKYEETLNETLKFFGLKLVLGVTTAGAITWMTKPTEKEEIKKPTTLKEFQEESDKVLEKIKKIDQIPVDKLDAVIKDLDFSIQVLNLQAFKEAGVAFLEKIKDIIKRFITEPIDNTRLKILKRWNGYIDEVQQELEEYMNQPAPIKKSSETLVQEIKAILSQWLPK